MTQRGRGRRVRRCVYCKKSGARVFLSPGTYAHKLCILNIRNDWRNNE